MTQKEGLTTMIFMLIYVALAVISRWAPHAPNFTPLLAMGLFAAIFWKGKKEIFIFPFVALFVSDLLLGFYDIMVPVYLSMGVAILIGQSVQGQKLNNWVKYSLGVFAASVFFFLSSNFSVWAFAGLYPKTTSGLWECYIAALPFFKNTLASTAFYGAILLGVKKMVDAYVPAATPAKAK